jgi:hypothetical protein
MKNRLLPAIISFFKNIKKRFIVSNAIFLTLVATVIVIGDGASLSLDVVRGEEPTYTITLNEANTPISLSTIDFGSGTGTARYVDFDYSIAKRATGYHVLLDVNGIISNNVDTRITSMKSLTATFSGGQATLKTGWRVLPTVNPQILTSGTPVAFTDNPYFFSITNTGVEELSLLSLVITYSCTPSEVPGGETQFGMYPQSEVTDDSLISTLTTSAGTLPSTGNNQSWTDYGYYISGAVSSFMWYIDLINESNEYRGVYFTSYRPIDTNDTSSAANSNQDNKGYTTNSVYWFRFEPITWRVLDVQSGNAFLLADLVLDSQDYYYSYDNRTINEATIYPNNYEYSHIRSWLNDNFYNTAFTIEEKARIQTTTVDNSAASTGSSYNPNACSDTSDKVFLLSYLDVTNAAYGFNTSSSRELLTSAYSKAQGVVTDTSTYSEWWLRSPRGDDAIMVKYIYELGEGSTYVRLTILGVVPALWISL